MAQQRERRRHLAVLDLGDDADRAADALGDVADAVLLDEPRVLQPGTDPAGGRRARSRRRPGLLAGGSRASRATAASGDADEATHDLVISVGARGRAVKARRETGGRRT